MDYISIIITIGIVYLIITTIFTGYLANQKGYSAFNWHLLGLLFGFIALLVAIGLPKKEKTEKPKPMESDPNDISRFI